jgi:phosphatidylinositol kinase/protein kinase (PI-3  family)
VTLLDIKDVTFDEAQTTRLVASASASYIAAYVLGLKDRHYDNILIKHTDGTLFHIDFGFIFGMSPSIDTAEFAITPELMRLLGTSWTEFIDVCVQAFMLLRENSDLVISMVCRVFDSPCFLVGQDTQSLVVNYLRSSLFVGMGTEEVQNRMKQMIMNSPNKFKTKLKNTMHAIATGRY